MFFICKFIELYEFLLFVTISMHVRIRLLKNAEKKKISALLTCYFDQCRDLPLLVKTLPC